MTVLSVLPYPIHVRRGALQSVAEIAAATAPAHAYALISDTNVAPRYAASVARSLAPRRVQLFVVEAGEAHKTRESWARLTDEMLAAGFGRDSAVVALGGGVVGDLAGFVAATYMRGVPYLQLPTSLLAMIDASVGGKTGVDTPAGKNLVGAFHPPAAVVVDPSVLASLPPAHLRAACAEAIKHGVVADAPYFDRLNDQLPALLGGAAPEVIDALIIDSIAIKADVVRRDERESGLRKILNFGHTIGHAVEALDGFRMLHGEAVSIGMALESRLAERAGIAEPGTANRVTAALRRAGLPVERPRTMDSQRILAATRSDKKARAGAVEYALPACIGRMAGDRSGWSVRVDDALVREVLA